MGVKLTVLVECLPAIVTDPATVIHMVTHMTIQGAIVLEGEVAYLADDIAFCLVDKHMGVDVTFA